MYEFGSGTMWGVNSAANSTPKKFGVLQDVSVDFTFNLKELYGGYAFPISIARGTGKITCKAKFADLNGRQLNDIFFNQAYSNAQVLTSLDESGSIAGTPYQVTVTNSATFVQDLGVRNAVTGLEFVKVSASPATGQYSVSSGIYTFAAADTGTNVLISYTYTSSSTGSKIIITNPLLGAAPSFQVAFTQSYSGSNLNIQLSKCVSSKLSFATKIEDFTIPEFDFMAMADSSGSIGTISLSE